MSMGDSYFLKFAVLNEEFRNWVPLNSWRETTAVERSRGSSNNSPENAFLRGNLKNVFESKGTPMTSPYFRKTTETGVIFASKISYTFEPTKELYFGKIQCNQELYFGKYSQKPKPKSEVESEPCAWRDPLPGHACLNKQTAPNLTKEVTRQKHRAQSQSNICNYCKQNGSPLYFYTSHRLKDSFGNVECPILRAHTCETCGATGRKAHSKSYCPVLKANGKKPLRNAASLKMTLHNSCGHMRKFNV